jgi:hypothetical protein
MNGSVAVKRSTRMREALDDQVDVVAVELDDLEDPRAVPTRYIPPGRDRPPRIALRDDGDELALADDVVEQVQRLPAPDGDRHDRVREQHAVAQREDPELGGTITFSVDAGPLGRVLVEDASNTKRPGGRSHRGARTNFVGTSYAAWISTFFGLAPRLRARHLEHAVLVAAATFEASTVVGA